MKEEINEKAPTVKIALIGSGKVADIRNILSKYCKKEFIREYADTLGIEFLEFQTNVKNTPVNLVFWNICTKKDFMKSLQIVCEGAHAVIYFFDLSDNKTLTCLRDFYKSAFLYNNIMKPILVGTRFDLYYGMQDQEKMQITEKAKKFAKAINAPLVYCSEEKSINIKKIFQIIIGKVFSLTPKIDQVDDYHLPIVLLNQE